MLELKNVTKTYGSKDNAVHALKGVSIAFRPCEFVSILGPSGCGKTTLLNIIGGLDRYSDGDLCVDGKSTKEYKDRDWDTYRNHSIGFVFQSYNLIPHLTILENVELTMTLGGVARAERKKKAKDALIAVGLQEKLNKKPNELSGGQMQRVSIARALAGDPDIILADEPTGALDTETSESVMQLLKEISKTKLIIMVTHNPDLALKYSDRIIKMLDGKIIEDNKPFNVQEKSTEADEQPAAENRDEQPQEKVKYKKKHSSMSFFTALRLSGKNLLSKMKRTIITSLAASIGIIGIAVILSVSSGMQAYIDKTMLDSTSFNIVAINSTTSNGGMQSGMMGGGMGGGTDKSDLPEYPENTTGVLPYKPQKSEVKKQKLSKEFITYIEEKCKNSTVDITYSYNVDLNILTKNGDDVVYVNGENWNESLNNADYLADKYTVLASETENAGIPKEANEVALVVDKYNRLSSDILDALGITYGDNLSEVKYSELIGKEYRVVFNDGWYNQNGDIFRSPNEEDYGNVYNDQHGITVKIVSVLREEKESSSSWLDSGIAYTPALTELLLSENKNSAVAIAQSKNENIDVTTGKPFSEGGVTLPNGMTIGIGNTYEAALEKLGYTQTPTQILIYPIDVASRDKIMEYLDAWNTVHEGTDETIEYIDMSSIVSTMLGTIVDIITWVLLAFSIVSLVISSIMIAIIIYASVIERTKEIGVLRSIGARKKDVSRVFRAEALILGVVSGTIAILITLIINAIINAILGSLVGITTIASLPVLTAFGLIALSAILLLIASLIPARMAAKKEPAVALRSE